MIVNFTQITKAGVTLTGNEIEALTALLKRCTGSAMKGVAELGRVKAEFESMGATGCDYNVELKDDKVYIAKI